MINPGLSERSPALFFNQVNKSKNENYKNNNDLGHQLGVAFNNYHCCLHYTTTSRSHSILRKRIRAIKNRKGGRRKVVGMVVL